MLGRNPAVGGNSYFEMLFYGSSHLDSEDTAVAVQDDAGKSYAIPKPCMRQPPPGAAAMACSANIPTMKACSC